MWLKRIVKISKPFLGGLKFQIDLSQETGALRARLKCILTFRWLTHLKNTDSGETCTVRHAHQTLDLSLLHFSFEWRKGRMNKLIFYYLWGVKDGKNNQWLNVIWMRKGLCLSSSEDVLEKFIKNIAAVQLFWLQPTIRNTFYITIPLPHVHTHLKLFWLSLMILVIHYFIFDCEV